MNSETHYSIGTPGQKWGTAERAEWLSQQRIKRSYAEDVMAQFDPLAETCTHAQVAAVCGGLDYLVGE